MTHNTRASSRKMSSNRCCYKLDFSRKRGSTIAMKRSFISIIPSVGITSRNRIVLQTCRIVNGKVSIAIQRTTDIQNNDVVCYKSSSVQSVRNSLFFQISFLAGPPRSRQRFWSFCEFTDGVEFWIMRPICNPERRTRVPPIFGLSVFSSFSPFYCILCRDITVFVSAMGI